MARFILEGCRSTGKGAYTTMGGTPFEESGSGKHWKESLEVEIGDKVCITDISNSGKHYCHKIEITAVNPEVEYKDIKRAEDDRNSPICPVCGERT